jgi:hypothetical protein
MRVLEVTIKHSGNLIVHTSIREHQCQIAWCRHRNFPDEMLENFHLKQNSFCYFPNIYVPVLFSWGKTAQEDWLMGVCIWFWILFDKDLKSTGTNLNIYTKQWAWLMGLKQNYLHNMCLQLQLQSLRYKLYDITKLLYQITNSHSTIIHTLLFI